MIDKPRSAQFQLQPQTPLARCCPSRSFRQQREAPHDTCHNMTKGQQVSFESAEIQIAHERDEYSVGPQFVHVPHLRAIDEKFLFACNATVDPEAPLVPQVAHAVESLRVQGKDKLPTSTQAFIFCSSEHLMWDVGETCWWADQLNFLSFRRPAYPSGERVTH